MSDFDDLVLPTEPEPDPEPAPEPEPEPTEPEPASDTPIWEKYGFDSQEAMDKKFNGLSQWEKDLQREASVLGAQRAQQPAPEPVADESEDIWEQLDPSTAKQLKAAIRKEAEAIVASTVGPRAEVAEELFNDSAAKRFNELAQANSIDPDELYTFMGQHNLFPSKPSLRELEAQISLATAAFKGQNIESEVQKRLADEMAKLKKEGAEVKAVEPAAKKAPSEPDDDFTSMSFLDKVKAAAKGSW